MSPTGNRHKFYLNPNACCFTPRHVETRLFGKKSFASKLNANAKEFVSQNKNINLMDNDYRGHDVASNNNYVANLSTDMICSDGDNSGYEVQVEDNDVYSILHNLRIKNINKIIIAHLNINSLRYKFDILSDIIVGKIDILLISETKLDDSFPTSYFTIKGYSQPFRLDRSINGINGGGILLYIREDIPCKRLDNISYAVSR